MIHAASPVGPARTRSRTRRYLTSGFLRGLPQVPGAGGLPGHVRRKSFYPGGDEHEIVGKPEPEPEQIVVDDALQPPQRVT